MPFQKNLNPAPVATTSLTTHPEYPPTNGRFPICFLLLSASKPTFLPTNSPEEPYFIKSIEGYFAQRGFFLPLQYFRQHLIFAYLGESNLALESMNQALSHYREFRQGELKDDEEIYGNLLGLVSEFDSHLPWLEEAMLEGLKR